MPADPDQSQGFLCFGLWTVYLVAPLYISAGNLRCWKFKMSVASIFTWCDVVHTVFASQGRVEAQTVPLVLRN